MKLPIHNINEVKISGVSIQLNPQENEYKERYFQWTPYNLKTSFNGQEIISGRLIGWHHAPVFTEVETHGSDEMFFFTHGECIMIFCDLKNGIPALETVQLARIPAGTQVLVHAGKAHFVPVATGDYFEAVLYAPVQDSPRASLAEPIEGIV